MAIYARGSNDGQEAGGLTISDQIAAANHWIEVNGATLIQVFSEIQASHSEEGSAILGMIAFAERDERPIDIILVNSMSRLSRRTSEFMQLRERLRRQKISIISLADDFDSDPDIELTVAVADCLDRFRSADRSLRIIRALRGRRAAA